LEQEIQVEPEKSLKENQLHISHLPHEIIVSIFQVLCSKGVYVLYPLTQVCKQWYIYTQDPLVWRHVCHLFWRKDYELNFKLYLDWKKMYQERPRVRFDGIYISKFNYIRQV